VISLYNFNNYKGAGNVMAYSAIGEVVGNVIGLIIPDSYVSDSNIGHALGILLGAMYSLGWIPGYKTKTVSDLKKKLLDIDRLFLQDKITEEERTELRKKCLEDY